MWVGDERASNGCGTGYGGGGDGSLRGGTFNLFEYVLPTVIFVVASRTADVMGG